MLSKDREEYLKELLRGIPASQEVFAELNRIRDNLKSVTEPLTAGQVSRYHLRQQVQLLKSLLREALSYLINIDAIFVMNLIDKIEEALK